MINITETARDHIANTLARLDKPYLIFGLKGGGCAGFEYFWVPATEEEYNIKGSPEEDEFFDLGNNKKLVLDSVSQMYLIGSTIDYKSDFISSQLTVINPMAKSSCGCGTSIAV